MPTLKPISNDKGDRTWRCNRCRKLLGKLHDDRVHVKFARGHQYLASTPITSVCRCGYLNELLKLT